MEDFTPIKGFETYGINKKGEVICFRRGKLLSQYTTNDGYKKVTIVNPSGPKTFLVHRLVGMQFIENSNPEKYNEIDHIDRDKSNNNVDNLRWADDIIQSRNTTGWGKLGHKHITMEYGYCKKQPYTSYRFQISGVDIGRHSKRFRTDKYSLQDAVDYRNEFLKKNGLEIPD